jgi:hypothetical protein
MFPLSPTMRLSRHSGEAGIFVLAFAVACFKLTARS